MWTEEGREAVRVVAKRTPVTFILRCCFLVSSCVGVWEQRGGERRDGGLGRGCNKINQSLRNRIMAGFMSC